eukprot:scaffold218474_cov38-Prasinocladus_malaysianus.AAC.1
MLAAKKFAVFGCGDAKLWPDNFVDAMDEIHTTLCTLGASPVGAWKPPSDQGYLFTKSKSFRPDTGHFVGLAIDNINQRELTAARVRKWCEQLCDEFVIQGVTLSEPCLGDVVAAPAPVDELPYPYHAKSNWSMSGEEYILFGTRMTSRWYQMGGGSGAAGRWIKFMDSHMLMRAGLRGQPEYQL